MDIFILIYLSIKIYRKAQNHDERPWYWVFRLTSLFIATEFVVGFIVVSKLGMDKILYAAIPSLILAGLSAYFVFQQLGRIITVKKNDRFESLREEKEKPNLDHFR
jgi:Co/Zn/Cd efflux system component